MAGTLENSSSFWLAKAAIAKSFANRKPHVDVYTRDSLCTIVSNLYLSSCHIEAQKELLRRKGVTHILQVGRELSPTHPTAFNYKHVPVYDLEEEDLVKYFPECFDFINAGRENGAVLVHCAAGVSRSASVVIGYLMATGGLSMEDARAAVKAARPAINPNQGFLLQLQLFQEAGCSTEGWQHWDLERFLKVRSAAYSRADTRASIAVAADVNSGSLMRGACELSPPVLGHEDSTSTSPGGSPTHSPARNGGGNQGTFFSLANSTAMTTPAAVVATAVMASDQPGASAPLPGPVSAGASGSGGSDIWSASEGNFGQEPTGMGSAYSGVGSGCHGAAGTATCSQGGGSGNGGRALGHIYRLPYLPAVGGAAAGAVVAAASATWSAIVAVSGSLEAGRFWRPHAGSRPAPPLQQLNARGAAAVAVAPADARAEAPPMLAEGGSSPPLLPLSRSLQRQLSADDAVAPVMALVRPAAMSLPSIGSIRIEPGSALMPHDLHNNSRTYNYCTNIKLTSAPAFNSAAAGAAAAATGNQISFTSGPGDPGSTSTGLAPTRARTASGVPDTTSLAACAAVQAYVGGEASTVTPGSQAAWVSSAASPAVSNTGQLPPAMGLVVGLGFGTREGSDTSVEPASSISVWPSTQHANNDWGSDSYRAADGSVEVGRNNGEGVSLEAATRCTRSASEVLHDLSGIHGVAALAGNSTSTTFILPDPRAPWPSDQLQPSPPQPWLSQPSFEGGAPPALSPIPSDGGCSDEACRSDVEEDGSGLRTDISAGGMSIGSRIGGSERQLRLEGDMGLTPMQRLGRGRHGFLRRSLSDRLQGMLSRAYHMGMDAAVDRGSEESTQAGAESAGHTVSVPHASPFNEATTPAGSIGASGSGITSGYGAGSGLVGFEAVQQELVGLRAVQQEEQQHEQQQTWSYGSSNEETVPVALAMAPAAPVHPAGALRLSAGSVASTGALALLWPEGSGSDGTTNTITTASRGSGGDSGVGGANSGGGCASGPDSSVTSPCDGFSEGSGLYASSPTAALSGIWQGCPVRNAPVSPEQAVGSWAVRQKQRWALLPILTPAGLERTPSRVPQAPEASDAAIAANVDTQTSISHTQIGLGSSLQGATEWTGFRTGYPEGLTPPSREDLAGGDTTAAARSAALKHLVAAQALSHGSTGDTAGSGRGAVIAAAASTASTAMAAGTLYVRSDPEITVSRSPSIGSATGSPRSHHVEVQGDFFNQSRQPGSSGPPGSINPDDEKSPVQPAPGQHGRVRVSGTGAKLVTSRLATTTYANTVGSRIESAGFNAIASYDDLHAAGATGGGGADGNGDVDGDIKPTPSLQRYSAPMASAVATLRASAPHMAPTALQPPADLAASPSWPHLMAGPARSLRLSIGNLNGGTQGGSDGGLAADPGRGEGGSSTPIHKRVLRSLTSFLGRSPESPTAAASVPPEGGGQGRAASGEEQPSTNRRPGTGAALRLKLWVVHKPGMAPASTAAAPPPPPTTTLPPLPPPPPLSPTTFCDNGRDGQSAADVNAVVDRVAFVDADQSYFATTDESTTSTMASTVEALKVFNNAAAGTAVQAALPIPPRAFATPCDPSCITPDGANMLSQLPLPVWDGLTPRAAEGDAYGRTADVQATISWDEGSRDDTTNAGSPSRDLSRSESASPFCAEAEVPTVAGEQLAWLLGGRAESSRTTSRLHEGVGQVTGAARPAQEHAARPEHVFTTDRGITCGDAAAVNKLEATPGVAGSATGSLGGSEGGLEVKGGDAATASGYKKPGEAPDEEEVFGLDLLPNGPFHWGSGPNAEESQTGPGAGVAAAGIDGAGCETGPGFEAAWTVRGTLTDDAIANPGRVPPAAAAAGPVVSTGGSVRSGAWHLSLDGHGSEYDGLGAGALPAPRRETVTWEVLSVGGAPGSTAAGAASPYLASLATLASTALPLELTASRAAATALSPEPAATIASAPALADSSTSWYTLEAASKYEGGVGNISDSSGRGRMKQDVPPGIQALSSPPPPGDHGAERQSVAPDLGIAAATRGSAVVTPDQEPPVGSRPSAGADVANSGASARQPRSSYSGALCMQPIMSRHELEVSAGTGAEAIVRPQAPNPAVSAADALPGTGGGAQQLLIQACTNLGRQGSLGTGEHTPLPLPLPGTQPLVGVTQQLQQQQYQHYAVCNRGEEYSSAASSGGADLDVVMPAWGGSRSSASLLTVPSDPEPPIPQVTAGPTGHYSGPQGFGGLESRQQQQQQQQQDLRHNLSDMDTNVTAVQFSRATARSFSTGCSAAAHGAAAAAGSLMVDSSRAWEYLRGARQHQRQWPKQPQQQQQQQQPQQQQPPAQRQSLPSMDLSGVAAAAFVRPVPSDSLPLPGMASLSSEAGDPWVIDYSSTEPKIIGVLELESPPGQPVSTSGILGTKMATADSGMSILPTPTASAAAQSSPSAPAQTPVASAPAESSTSPSETAAAAAVGTASAIAAGNVIRLSLSPTASSGGSSTSVQSPRAPPVVNDDMLEVDPWDLDAMDGQQRPEATTSVAVPAPASPVTLGRSRGRLDPSLLKPVLGRRLLPMPAPSRIIGSSAGTPRGSSGGAGAGLHMPTSPVSAIVQLSPQGLSQLGTVDGIAHVTAPPPPHFAVTPRGGAEVRSTRFNNAPRAVLQPQELCPSIDTVGQQGSATAVAAAAPKTGSANTSSPTGVVGGLRGSSGGVPSL